MIYELTTKICILKNGYETNLGPKLEQKYWFIGIANWNKIIQFIFILLVHTIDITMSHSDNINWFAKIFNYVL